MFAYEYGGEIIVVDAGLLFPEEEMLGVDVVIPDITYLVQNAEKVRAIILTHGHEDHIGALPWVLGRLNVPVWGTKLTLGFVRRKLTEYPDLASVTLSEIDPNEILQFGPFTVGFFRVTHSIPDGVGLTIETPAGVVIHTGDYKLEHSPLAGPRTEIQKIAVAGSKGVMALVTDVVNAGDTGWVPSEVVVAISLNKLFINAEGRIIVSCFASNIARIEEICNLSIYYKRKICILGRSMRNNIEVAIQLGFINSDVSNWIVNPEDIADLPANGITILASGSQGEPFSALRLMSVGEQKHVKLKSTDLVIISARPISGNENGFYKTVDHLYRQGAEVIYQNDDQVHVSGHGNEEDLKMMLALTTPQFVVPTHGEYRHLVRYRKLAENSGIPPERVCFLHSGDILEITQEKAEVIGKVQAGRVMIDGLGEGDIDAVVLRDRKHLSEDGMVIAIIVINSITGQLIAGPDIVTRGFVYLAGVEEILEEAKTLVQERIQSLTEEEGTDTEFLKSAVKSVLKKFIYGRTKRRPMIIPEIIEV